MDFFSLSRQADLFQGTLLFPSSLQKDPAPWYSKWWHETGKNFGFPSRKSLEQFHHADSEISGTELHIMSLFRK